MLRHRAVLDNGLLAISLPAWRPRIAENGRIGTL